MSYLKEGNEDRAWEKMEDKNAYICFIMTINAFAERFERKYKRSFLNMDFCTIAKMIDSIKIKN